MKAYFTTEWTKNYHLTPKCFHYNDSRSAVDLSDWVIGLRYPCSYFHESWPGHDSQKNYIALWVVFFRKRKVTYTFQMSWCFSCPGTPNHLCVNPIRSRSKFGIRLPDLKWSYLQVFCKDGQAATNMHICQCVLRSRTHWAIHIVTIIHIVTENSKTCITRPSICNAFIQLIMQLVDKSTIWSPIHTKWESMSRVTCHWIKSTIW